MGAGINANLAPVRLDRPFGDGQAEPGAAAVARPGCIEAKEAIEDALAVFGRDSRPLIQDGHDRLIPRRLDANVYLRGSRAVFDGVVDDVRDRLAKHETIGCHPDAVRRVDVESLMPLFRENTER